ncbi:MAG TPA: TonB-dependent receptor [Thermoanaerobaculia bacterium]|nr:TonB-dependent receptor [Thermoanaerobaculia bacterium]
MNHAKNLRTALLVFALAILVPLAALGQSSTGAISGTVTDANGGAMPGVTVTATNIATHAIRTVVSNGVGHYEVPLLPPGVYKVVAELSGFQPVSSVMNINVGTDATFDVKLKPGVTETVTVTASAPMVETTKSEISSVVNEKAIQNLPTNGRNFIDFVLTTPGVVKDVRGGDISFAGQRGTLNSMVVDGANNDNTFFGQTVGRTGSGRAPYQFSQDAVKEFQVNSNAYSAEYGRAGGAVINVVTKSGTNDFHGSVFDYYRDKRLNTNDYINVINGRAKSPYHFDQYGFSAGGPIVRDKHFFFANVDLQRNSTPNPVVLGGGRIANFPTDAASQAAIQTLTPLAAEYSRKQNQNVYLFKSDHELLVNNHLSLRYNQQRFTGVNFENGGITNSVQHSGNSKVLTDSLSAVHDMTASSSFFNEVRAQYLKDREPGEANSSDPEAQIFQGGVAVLTIGRNSFSPRETTIKRYQIADTASYILANHTIKGGFDYNHDNILNYFPGNFFGVYVFNSLADFANKNPARFSQAFPGPGTTGPFTHPNLKETGLFLQDEWHAMQNLTLNIGLRFDRQAMAQPTVQNPDAQLLAAGYTTNKIPIDNNIGPRLGFAWTPTASNRTVIRGGYGVFYGRIPSIMIGTAHSNNGINVQTITFTGNLTPSYPAIYSSLPTGVTLPKPTIFVFDQHFQNPRVQQANLGFEQQLGSDYAFGVNYQYVKGDHLSRSRDVNVSNPTPTTFKIAGGDPVTVNRYTGRPFTNFTRLIAFESSARSKYNGVTFDLQKRYSNNWQTRISWTHGMVKDNKPDATAVVPFSSGDDAKYVSDPLNIDHDYTYGDNDVRDRVVLSGVWSLDGYAQGLKNNILHALGSGWTISGIVSYQTGQPFTPNVGTDLLNDGNPSNDIAPGFTRNSNRLPSQFSVDPRITRDIPIFAGAKLQLIAEAFNVLNKHNVTAVNRTFYSFNATTSTFAPLTAFGTPTATAGQRIVQLAGKVTF